MTRGCLGALLAIALAAGLALRLARLDVRPMHHDEANQAVKFGALLERAEYRYDAHDHHGPTLYYLSLPAAWLRGQATLAALDERTLRGVTVAFGAATILLLPLLSAGIGRTAVAAGAWLMALSPAMVFYSRMYIQESLFACFTLAFLIALGRAVLGGGLAWWLMAGTTAGLVVATKETALVVFPAVFAALAAARATTPGTRFEVRASHVAAAAVVAVTLAAVLFSSFFSNPAGVLGPFGALGTYLNRGVDPATHAHPWHYYVSLLAYSSSGGLRWSEGLVLGLALAGLAGTLPFARRQSGDRPDDRGENGGDSPAHANGTVPFWTRYLAVAFVLTAAIFSVIRYKTPWNLVPFHTIGLVLAGIGFAAFVHATSSRVLRVAIVIAFVAASAHLGWQAWRASVTYAADPRNPYVYAHTVPDAVRMSTRIKDLASLHPDGERMLVAIVAPPHEQWPMPWYLRSMPHVGYWTTPGDALPMDPPVVVASLEHADAVDAVLGDRYVSEFYGLRPEVPLALFIENGLWERFLAKVTGDGAMSRGPGGLPLAPTRQTAAVAVASWDWEPGSAW
jgi:uncharacterized protein (TIGR03663 family)